MENENVGSRWDFMLSALINSIKSKNMMSFDGNNNNELDSIQKISKIPAFRELTSNWISSLSVSNNVSLKITNEFRTIGNELYKNLKQNGMKVVDFYTRAVFSAPNDSEELAYGHANRAAALLSLGYYKEAHSDCQLARKHSYPKSKVIKVLRRQANCSIKMQNYNQLMNDLSEIRNTLDELKINHIYADMLQKLSAECEMLKANFRGNENETTGDIAQKMLIENQNSHKGRFMIASEYINIDDLIIKEKAFAFIPVYQQFEPNPIDKHCQNCAATNIIPFPCGLCKRATYCGIKCLNEHVAIHRYECNGYKKHLWYEIGIAHLSLRTMLCGITDAVTKLKSLCDATPLVAWNELFLAVEESHFEYGSVLKLVTNFDKTNTDDFLGYVLTAIMITSYLRDCTQFFDDLIDSFPKLMSDSSWEIIIASIITRHIGQLICNGHAISDFEIDNFECFQSASRLAKGTLSLVIQSQRIFTAIFPRISIFNHSCNPNIRNKFNNDELMVHASRVIDNGDEILNCYGPNSKLNQRRERQELLNQQYHFQCDCLPCIGQDQDYLKSHTYICPCGADVLIVSSINFWWRNCTTDGPPEKIVCSNCSHNLKFNWVIEFREAMQQWDCEFDNFNSSVQMEELMLKAIAKYENASKFMKGDINSQKLDMANMLLKYVVQSLNLPDFNTNERIKGAYKKIKNISVTSLIGCEYKFGRYSLEYVSSLAMFMDITAIYGQSEENLMEIRVFDVFGILSDRTKEIFVNYFEEFIRKDVKELTH